MVTLQFLATFCSVSCVQVQEGNAKEFVSRVETSQVLDKDGKQPLLGEYDLIRATQHEHLRMQQHLIDHPLLGQ